jgi:hypothetical protein
MSRHLKVAVALVLTAFTTACVDYIPAEPEVYVVVDPQPVAPVY